MVEPDMADEAAEEPRGSPPWACGEAEGGPEAEQRGEPSSAPWLVGAGEAERCEASSWARCWASSPSIKSSMLSVGFSCAMLGSVLSGRGL